MNLPSHQESKAYCRWLQFLTALFFWLFMVILILPLGPAIYGPNPIATVLLLLLLAVGGSFYAAVHPFQGLAVFLKVLFFLLLQWSVVLLWGWAGGEKMGKVPLSPWQFTLKYSKWWIPATITWFGAKGLGRLIYGLQLRPDCPVRSWDKQWDEDSLDMTFWVTYLRAFQFSVTGLIGIAVTMLAISPNLAGGLLPLPLDPGRILLWLLTCTGLVLLTAGNFYYKHAFWCKDGLEVDSSLRKAWQTQTAKVLLFLSILTWVLPANIKAAGWRGILWIFNNLVSSLPKSGWQEITIEPPPKPSFQPEVINPDNTPSGLFDQIIFFSYFLLIVTMGVILISLVLFFIGSLLYRAFGGELDKMRGLPKALVRFYLLIRRLWQTRRQKTGILGQGEISPLEREENSARKQRRIIVWGRGARAVIRRGYYRLLVIARQQGLLWRTSQTPEEIGLALTEMLPEEAEAVNIVTSGYQEARYGPEDPPKEKLLRFERWRRVLQKRLGVGRKKTKGG